MKYCGIKYRLVRRILLDNGWECTRQSGSHSIWKKDGKCISVPAIQVNQMLWKCLCKENNIKE